MAVTELRVHGVGGSTPEQVLNSGPATRVAGDAEAGFYTAGDPHLEAYCWGNLTSGGVTRAFWLLMLPFTLVNASFWMGPRRRVNEGVVRLLALSLTATALLAAEGIGTDLIGWQCAARPTCRGRHTWLRFVGHGVMAGPGRRAAVGTAVPLAVLALLWWLSRRTGRHEQVPPPPGNGTAPLEDPTFWYGARQVARLRHLHLSVGLAVVGLGLAFPCLAWDRHHDSGLEAVDASVVVGLWLVLVVSSCAVFVPAVVRRDPPGVRGVAWTAWVQQAAAVLAVTSLLVAVLPDRPGWLGHTARSLPGYSDAVTAVFLSQLLGIALLAGVVARHRDPAAGARGLGQPLFGALGLLVASVFSAGIAFRSADWLDGGKNPTAGPLTVPLAYEWAAVALLAVAVPGTALLLWRAWTRYATVSGQERARVRGDYAVPEGQNDRVRTVARVRGLASLTDSVMGWLAWFTSASIVAAVTAMTLTMVTGDAPERLGDGSGVLRFATLAGTWMVSGFAAGLVLVGYRSYRQASLRKTVGILWDLGTFWPRAAHPLAPPCYAERCIPDLAVRIGYLVQRDGGVLLSAHSQGTVLSAALVWQLPHEVLSRVRLVTYGSPVARLYGPMYTAWFGPSCLKELDKRLGEGHWVNLWRRTDPIGGPIAMAGDVELRHDPDSLGRDLGDPAFKVARGHFDYELTRDYATARSSLMSTLDQG